MHEHCHFYCDHCDEVFDVDLSPERGDALPRGFRAERYDIADARCLSLSNARAR